MAHVAEVLLIVGRTEVVVLQHDTLRHCHDRHRRDAIGTLVAHQVAVVREIVRRTPYTAVVAVAAAAAAVAQVTLLRENDRGREQFIVYLLQHHWRMSADGRSYHQSHPPVATVGSPSVS